MGVVIVVACCGECLKNFQRAIFGALVAGVVSEWELRVRLRFGDLDILCCLRTLQSRVEIRRSALRTEGRERERERERKCIDDRSHLRAEPDCRWRPRQNRTGSINKLKL